MLLFIVSGLFLLRQVYLLLFFNSTIISISTGMFEGSDLTTEQAKDAARLVGISLLSTLKKEIGNLNNVKRIVKVFGMVNAIPTFEKQPLVINGCSDLMVEVFGENGKHARSAIGVASLPSNIPVEIEMIVELKNNNK